LTLRHVAIILAIPAAWLAGLSACSVRTCWTGVLPFDGQSAVPITSEIIFQVGHLPPDTPSLRESIELVDKTTGLPVPFHVAVELEVGTVRVIPDEPLEPGHDYYASGLTQAGVSVHRGDWFGGSGPLRAETTFRTASAPRVLEIMLRGDENVVVFVSEPIDEAELDIRFAWATSDGDTTQVRSRFLGTWVTNPHVLEYAVDTLDEDAAIDSAGRWGGELSLKARIPGIPIADGQTDEVEVTPDGIGGEARHRTYEERVTRLGGQYYCED
jgi:hypothetical protein